MKKSKYKGSKFLHFVKNNYIVTAFVVIIALTFFIAGFKILSSEDQYIYAKIKISQGLWWASTQRPGLWFAKSIKPGLKERSLSGKPSAEIIRVMSYPYWGSDTYDVYIVAKLKVTKNDSTGTYSFNRDTFGISSPIELKFPTVTVTGTIMDISDGPIEPEYTEKLVTLEKKHASTSEFENIQVGDTYNDGTQDVLEVLDKQVADSYSVYSSTGTNKPVTSDMFQDVRVTLKMKVKNENGNYMYGEEYIVREGKLLNAVTNNYVFEEFRIIDIE